MVLLGRDPSAPGSVSSRSPVQIPRAPGRPAVLDASRTALIPLRPLTMGEILDAGFLIVRRNARLMVGLPLVVAGGAAIYLLAGVGLWFLLGNTTVQGVQIALVVVMSLLGLLLLVQCLVWMTAILSRVSLQTVLGPGFAPATTAVTFRSSLPLFWPMLGLSVLQYLASAVIQTGISLLYYAVLLASLATSGSEQGPGTAVTIVVTVGMFALTAVSYSYLALTVPALATESRLAPGWIGKPYKATTVISSFERSVRLVGLRNLGRVALIFAGAGLICLGVVGLLAFGALAVVLLFATSVNADLNAVLGNAWTLFGVVSFAVVVAMSALLAYLAAVATLVYLDLRMRREGLDLALRFDCVQVPQPVVPPATVGLPWTYPQPAPFPPYGPRR